MADEELDGEPDGTKYPASVEDARKQGVPIYVPFDMPPPAREPVFTYDDEDLTAEDSDDGDAAA